MKKNIYSSYKVAHHLDRVKELRSGNSIMPVHVQIDLTNKCNHNCTYCWYRNCGLVWNFDADATIPLIKAQKLLNEFKQLGIPSVQFTGGGEPLMHPCFHQIIQAAINRGIEWALVTNGTLLNMNQIELYGTASWIRVSVDAASPEVYSRSQNADSSELSKVMSNISHLARNCPDTEIGASFVVNPINFKELYDFAVQMKNIGVSNVRLSVSYTKKGISLFADKWQEIREMAAAAKGLETENFKVFDLISEHLENLDMEQKGYSGCGFQHFTACLGADQVLYPCCTLKYLPAAALGSVEKKTFEEVWDGETRTKWLSSDYLSKICNNRPCWMDKKNKFIDYLISPNPRHVNFV